MQHGQHRRSPKSGSYISGSGPVSPVLPNIWLLIVIIRNVYGGCLFCCRILCYCHCYYLCCHLFVIELWFDVFQNYCNLPSNLPQCAGNKKFAFVFPPDRVEKKVFRAAGQKQLANMDQLEQRVEKQEWEDFFIIIRRLSFSCLGLFGRLVVFLMFLSPADIIISVLGHFKSRICLLLHF